jgi:hypothetical protein
LTPGPTTGRRAACLVAWLLAAVLGLTLPACGRSLPVGPEDGSIDGAPADAGVADDAEAQLDGEMPADAPPCANGCLLAGHCYAVGDEHPDTPCRRCTTGDAGASWGPNDGVACDDGYFCTVEDACYGGSCTGYARDCSDGVACNGYESCDTTLDQCVAGRSACTSGQICDLQHDECVTCAGCAIDGQCRATGEPHPSEPCLRCEPALDRDAWSPIADGELCDDGRFCTVGDACLGGRCVGTTRSCDDGVACNGLEECDPGLDSCIPGDRLCAPVELCDIATDSCVTDCAGCAIDGDCHADGHPNPRNPCEVCDHTASATSWTSADGASCDDGLFCNGADACAHGACTAHAGDPCDDGLFCNGVEHCLEGPRACTAGTDPCAVGGALCAEDLGVCCTPDVSRICDGAANVVAVDSCGRFGPVVAHCTTANGRGSCLSGTCGCAAGYAGEQCDRCLVFVRSDGDDQAAGTSWALAKQTVQAGIDSGYGLASTHPELSGCEVWVAAGTYLPAPASPGLSERSRAFTLRSRVHIYGGFAGDEVRRGQRDAAGHPTVLTGDVDGNGVLDDGNSYHVVVAGGAATDVTLDGLTITGGNANGADFGDQQSGGIALLTSSTLISNCTFRGNAASAHGGVSYIMNAAPIIQDSTFEDNSAVLGGGLAIWGAATVRRCTFRGNTVPQSGGGIWIHGGSPSIADTLLEGNVALRGGGITLDGGAATITRCDFRANQVATFGGGLEALQGAATIEGCTFTANVAADAGGGMVVMPLATPVVSGCLFEDNSAGSCGGGLESDGTLTVTDSVFRANAAFSLGGGLFMRGASSGAARCRFEANTAQSGGGVHAEGAGSWIADSVFVRNSTTGFAGAVHMSAPAPTITGCTFFENAGASGGGALGGDGVVGTVSNSIFWHNSAPEITPTGASWTFAHAMLVAGCPMNAACTALITAPPRFFDEGSGGMAPDLHLAPGSPCLDVGDNTAVATGTDLDGRPRIADGNGDGTAVVDLGAYERPGP